VAARRFVLIGAGQCAVAAAGALRALGFDGELIMVGAEAELPYERPPLSKDYLLGKTSAARIRIEAGEWFERHAVELRLRRIHEEAGVTFRTGERVRRVIECQDGLVVQTDRAELRRRLLLGATGIVPNTELLAGCGLDLAGGVPVDEYCRTGIEGIFAAGDVAAHFHRCSAAGSASSTTTTRSNRAGRRRPACSGQARRSLIRTGSGRISTRLAACVRLHRSLAKGARMA